MLDESRRTPEGEAELRLIERGRTVTRAILFFTVALAVLAAVLRIAQGDAVGYRLIRPAVALTFAVLVYRGFRWAAILSGLSLLGTAALAIVSATLLLRQGTELAPFAFALLAVAVIVGAMGVQFLFSPHVRAFQKFQRTGRPWPISTPRSEARPSPVAAPREERAPDAALASDATASEVARGRRDRR